MATSTFFDNITIDDKAAKIIANGLKEHDGDNISATRDDAFLREGEEALKRFRLRLRTQSEEGKN